MNNISVTKQVVELEYKSAAELRGIYNNLFPDTANCNARKEHLIHKIAYLIQELAYGGLDELTKLALEEPVSKNIFVKTKHSNLVAGTKICKEYQGIMHQVEVISDGFEYQGKNGKVFLRLQQKLLVQSGMVLGSSI